MNTEATRKAEEALLGRWVLVMTTKFYWAGVLRDADDRGFVLDDAWLVFETGPLPAFRRTGVAAYAEELGGSVVVYRSHDGVVDDHPDGVGYSVVAEKPVTVTAILALGAPVSARRYL